MLGNSFIPASPRHPLVALLLQYTRSVYAAKQATHAVEWVTGPLAYTKALIHTEMPGVIIAPQAALYHQFAPDPSAVDVNAFPDALAFQLGYTSSGIGYWVRRDNVCRDVRSCAVHGRLSYALGGLRPLPVAAAAATAAGDAPRASPRVVHQFWFALPAAAPRRWMDIWAVDFLADHPGWTVRVWDAAGMRAGFPDGLFAAHLYGGKARGGNEDDLGTVVPFGRLQLLALEVLHQYGGFAMPVSSLYVRGMSTGTDGGEPVFPTSPALSTTGGLASHPAGVLPAPSWSVAALAVIQAAAAAPSGAQLPPQSGTLPAFVNVHLTGVSDDVARSVSFPISTTYLGASAVVLLGQCPPRPVGTLLTWAYACQTRLGSASGGVPQLPSAAATALGPVVLATGGLTLAARPLLCAAIPGGIDDAAAGAAAAGWAVLALGLAHGETARGPGVASAPAPAGLPAGTTLVGMVVPSGAAAVAAD